MPHSSSLRSVFLASMLLAGLVWARDTKAAAFFGYTTTVRADIAPTLPDNPPGFPLASVPIGNGNRIAFLTNGARPFNASLTGGADINFGTINFNPSTNDIFTPYSINFNYEVVITDLNTTESGTVNFTGNISGNAVGTFKAVNSKITDYTATPQRLFLGGNNYLVSASSVVGPGSMFNGVLQANVQISAVPEPSTLILGGLGAIASLGIVTLRKRKRGV